MQANVIRDPSTATSIMAPTYMSAARTLFVQLMEFAGIKKIELKKLTVANLTKVVADVEYFYDLPPKLKAFSALAQRPLTELMSLFGIVSIDIEGTKEEIETMISQFDSLVAMSDAAEKTAIDANSAATPEEEGTTKACATKKSKCTCSTKSCSLKKTTKSTQAKMKNVQ